MNPLWLSAALPVATALLLGLVGASVARRRVTGAAGDALRAFALWWFCAGLVILLVGVRTVLYLAGVRSTAAYTAVSFLIPLPLAAGLAALLYYLLYLYTGRRWGWTLGIGYTTFLAFTLYYFFIGGARTPRATTWTLEMVSQNEPPVWLGVVFGALVAVPIIGTAIAYASLYGKAPRGEPRFRIAAVSLAFLLWFSPLFLAFVLGWNREAWFPLVYQVPGVVAAGLILVAYQPPRALKRRWRHND